MEKKLTMDNFLESKEKRIQIHFTEASGLHWINVKATSVGKIIIKNDVLMIHDLCDNEWHCYNMKHVIHFHIPYGVKIS